MTDCDKEEALLIEEGFKEGANWAINEFLKNLWHPNTEEPDMSKLCHTLWMPPKEYDKEQHCICNRYDTTSCNFTEMDMSKVFILAKNGRYIPFEEALKMRERINV
nr:MAG TPA: hypothetical protein [Caudoviricetes sp.]